MTVPQDLIAGHTVRLDAEGRLRPWTSWNVALDLEMNFYQQCPWDHGYPRFVLATFLDGNWTAAADRTDTIPATQNGMGIVSYLKFYELRGKRDPGYLATARAMGEVESLEALGIDPIHYLIVPRVIGMSLGVFSLTVFLIIGALVSGYLFAFLQDVPLTPGDYFKQIVESLGWLDFALLALKTIAFGFFIAIVTCYHGLAQPLRLDDVSRVAVRAVTQGVIVCVLIDVLFIVLYLVT